MQHFTSLFPLLFFFSLFPLSEASAEGAWDYKSELVPHLIKAVPGILERQDPSTGRFVDGAWIVQDQHPMLTLAAAWSLESDANPYYRSPDVLNAIMSAGDALIAEQDARGMWLFRKKDGSTWGDIYMPWTYSRWVRTYALIQEAMPDDRRKRWETALRLGYEGIVRNEFSHIHNIPAHHAMGLYCAGKALGRPDWSTTAARFLEKVAAAQYPDGFWSENSGPVVGYNLVYTDALGVYYGLSRDPAVLPALERAARFHSNFTYPDGSNVETVDERQVYKAGPSLPNVGFTHTPEGRGYLHRQWRLLRETGTSISAELAASLLLYGSEGAEAPTPKLREAREYRQTDSKAAVRRQGSWFACVSAYTSLVPKSRWIQDRQNLVSLFHDRVGLILGGGNTKLQPLWSTFTAGNPGLLRHTGEEEPDFTPPPGLIHVPNRASLAAPGLGLDLTYGSAECKVRVNLSETSGARLLYSTDLNSTLPLEAHLPLIAHLGQPWTTASGKQGILSADGWQMTAAEAGPWFAHAGWRVSLPPGTRLTWPVLPHNPYRKDGSATPEEGRIVLSLPFAGEQRQYDLLVEVP